MRRDYTVRSIAIIAIIASAAIGLAVLSLEYSNSIRERVLDIASHDARSNAEIQTHDISIALANKIEIVSSNLQLMSRAPLIQEQNVERVFPLFTSARDATSDVASSYFWLNAEGRLLWADAFVDEEIEREFSGADRSFRQYFIQPRDTMMPYYTTVIESVDLVPRLYIGHPIIGEDDGAFKGVLVAGIELDAIGRIAQEQLVANYPSSIGLLDKNGIILYSSNPSQNVGKNIFDAEIQSLVPPEISDSFNQLIVRALAGETGSADITTQDVTSTIAYGPVTVRGNEFAVLFVVTPHELAGSTVSLVEQLQLTNTFTVFAIGAVAAGTATMVLVWNRRLSRAVDQKTAELKSANDMLVESNRQLQAVNTQLANANEQLKVHDRLQDEFINVAAHELRTPVQPVLGIVEELEEKLAEGATEINIKKPEIEMLARNANRLVKLTSDILEASRIEAKVLKLRTEPVDMVEQIEGVVEDCKAFIGKGKEVEVVFHNQVGSQFVIEADRTRLFEVLSNLIKNAIKFTERGTVSVSLVKRDGQAEISVKDSGRGIGSEIMPRLFSKFVTDSDQGTGLGLFISRGIVEAHGGRVWAQNNPDGQGATFTFTLPVGKAKEIESE